MLKCFCEEPMSPDPDALDWCATSCGHMFHYVCLLQWRERSETCPQCRKPVKSNQMFRLYPAASEEKPENDANNTLQTCLDVTHSQLAQMTDLCKKKDGVIATLKVNADNDINSRRENEALKSLLMTFNSESLDKLFDDPNHFDEVLKGKVALMKEDEQPLQSTEEEAEITTVTQPITGSLNANTTVTQLRTEMLNATAERVTVDPETEAMENSLETLRDMMTRLSEITDNTD